MDGITRLEMQVVEMNDYNISKIFEFLKRKKELYEKFDNEEKSIKQMYKFICEKAKKLAKNNVAMVNDNIVYLWGITYFSKSNEELGLNKKSITRTAEKNVEEKKDDKKIKEKKLEDNQISFFQEVSK